MTRFELQTSGVGSDHSTKWATTNHYRCCLCKCRQNQFGLWSAILRSSLIYLVIVPIGKYFPKFLSSSLSTPMAFIEYRLAGSILRCKRGNYYVYPTLDRRAFKDWPLIFLQNIWMELLPLKLMWYTIMYFYLQEFSAKFVQGIIYRFWAENPASFARFWLSGRPRPSSWRPQTWSLCECSHLWKGTELLSTGMRWWLASGQ